MADLTNVQEGLPVRITGVSSSSGLPDNFLDVDSAGKIAVKLNDASGNSLNSTSNALNAFITNSTLAVTQSTSPWIVSDATTHTDLTQIDTDINATQGPVSPGTVALKSTLIGGQFNPILPSASSGQQVALQTDPKGRLITNTREPPGTLDVFGTTIVAPRQLQIDVQFFNGILTSLVNLTTSGSGAGSMGNNRNIY
jgi:hypothetical protein